MDLFYLAISAIFVNNILLAQYLGHCPFLGVSKRFGTALGMAAAIIFVTILSAIFTWTVFTFVLQPLRTGISADTGVYSDHRLAGSAR